MPTSDRDGAKSPFFLFFCASAALLCIVAIIFAFTTRSAKADSLAFESDLRHPAWHEVLLPPYCYPSWTGQAVLGNKLVITCLNFKVYEAEL